MKKILVIHTQYQIQGGEDIAVENEVKFLQNNFDIERLTFSNKIDSYFSCFSFFRNNNYQSVNALDES